MTRGPREDDPARRKRRRLGGAALLASLPFAVIAFAVVMSCSGQGAFWEGVGFYVAPAAWFILVTSGLFLMNIFGFRSKIANMLSAVIVAGGVGTLLGYAAAWGAFSRCFTF